MHVRHAVFISLACVMAQGLRAAAELEVDFDRTPEGDYTDARVRADWRGTEWVGLKGRSRIVGGPEALSGMCMVVKYPKGAVGPSQGGGQFKVKLPARDEYWCDYCVKFKTGFDFVKGGKLPGLTGGRSNTGGNRATGDGWSARYMWRRGGEIVIYLYHMDQRSKYGDDLALGRRFTPGRWHRLTQRIRVNTPGRKDGVIQVWVDGEQVLDRNDIRFRNVEGARVDHFYFSTFHGGHTADWAPSRDCYVCFDSFRILPTPERVFPSFLSKSVVHLKDVAGDLGRNRLGHALSGAEKRLASKDEEEAKEARRVVDLLEGHLARRRREIAAIKEHDPASALEEVTRLAALYRGSQKSKELTSEAKRWKKEPAVANELRARKVLTRIEASAEKLRAKLDGKSASDPAMIRRFGRDIAALRNGIMALKKRYPDTPSARRAVALAEELGIPLPK